MTVHQLAELNRHSYYLNQQARNLLLCLQSMYMRRLTDETRVLEEGRWLFSRTGSANALGRRDGPAER